jgi:hypothetical protein
MKYNRTSTYAYKHILQKRRGQCLVYWEGGSKRWGKQAATWECLRLKSKIRMLPAPNAIFTDTPNVKTFAPNWLEVCDLIQFIQTQGTWFIQPWSHLPHLVYRVVYCTLQPTGSKVEIIASLNVTETVTSEFSTKEVPDPLVLDYLDLIRCHQFYLEANVPTEVSRKWLDFHSKTRVPHDGAQVRSDWFAARAASLWKQQPDTKILTLDGRLRNVWALCEAGVDATSIIVVERCPVVALYQKLLCMPGTGALISGVSIVCESIQKFILNRPSTLHISALYLDFCGNLQPLLTESVQSLAPNLKLLGITQGKRNTSTTTFPVFTSFPRPAATFNQRSVKCRFMLRDNIRSQF